MNCYKISTSEIHRIAVGKIDLKIFLLLIILGVGLVVQLYDAERDCDSAYNKGYEDATVKEFYLKRNLKITLIQFVFSLMVSLWLKYSQIQGPVILICICVIPIYIIALKTGYKGYIDNLFDFVEAFSFSSILATGVLGMIGWTVVLLGFIYIADIFNNKQERFSLWVNLLAVTEFAIMFIIDKIFNITSLSLYSIIIFILLPHTVLKAINEIMSHVMVNKYT